jgi:hypothetical protein
MIRFPCLLPATRARAAFAARAALAVLLLAPVLAARAADPAPFDLVGPQLEIQVTRGSETLPITEVPALAPKDRLTLKALLPGSQGTHYLMVAAFLRGPTNPPPEDWFFRCDTWKPPCDSAGLTVTVPADAQQLLVFFAPQTGGDFKTLVGAVRGRPGSFVRASQQLFQAALDRARLERYLAGLQALGNTDPGRVKEAAPLMARSLAIKVEDKCLDRLPALQASCLMQGQDSLILNDGHSASLVSMVTQGPGRDLALNAATTPILGSGAYHTFIGSILDLGRLLDSIHTAQYQYIPALASVRGERLVLMLNTPPSFHNPLSVLVAALPPVDHSTLPPLRPVDGDTARCVERHPLVVPVEGAPLVFATAFAHDFTLDGMTRTGLPFHLAARPDPEGGGFLVETAALEGLEVDEEQPVTLRGRWGFDAFQGPQFHLVSARTRTWTMDSAEQAAVIADREDVVHLNANAVSCVDRIRLRDAAGRVLDVPWKQVDAGQLELHLPLQGSPSGPLTLTVEQLGATASPALDLTAYADPSRLDGIRLHVGDASAVVRGRGLEQVATLEVDGLPFEPAGLASTPTGEELRVVARAPGAGWRAGETRAATLRLRDGRAFPVPVKLLPPRPRVQVVAKNVKRDPESHPITLGEPADLPLGSVLTFSIRAESPASFARNAFVEVAASDGSFSTRLDLGNGGLALVDSGLAVATLDFARAFGPSAYGPLQFRIGAGDDTGDWEPLGRLVRLPALKRLACRSDADARCELAGSKLFLVDSIATNPQMTDAQKLPDGFPGFSLGVPRPVDGRLYLRLRDDPDAVNVVKFGAADTRASD